MQITGTYQNYQNITNLLTPLGVKGSGDLIMEVFSTSVRNLQKKINDQVFSEESNAAVTQLYSQISNLSETAQKLKLTDMYSVFNDRTAQSSDSNVLTGAAFDAFSQESGATEATYTIAVTQLAQAQENVGIALSTTEVSPVNEGTNTFNININGHDQELIIEVQAGDTNETVFRKIETAINEAGIGVTADVITGSSEGTQQLTIRNNTTGQENTFSISDVDGNVVAETGLGVVSTDAQDAVYSVDGTDYVSGNNNNYLDGGLVEVALRGEGEATLTVAPDQGKVEEAISNFISGLNEFTDFFENNEAYIKDDALSTVHTFVADHKQELESLGISEGEDGRLIVDNSKLSEAVSQNLSDIKRTFGGFDGLGEQITGYTSHIATDSPLNYVKEAGNLSPNFTDYIYSSSVNMLTQILQGTLFDDFI
jgi:flagellar hook-associated protein 2